MKKGRSISKTPPRSRARSPSRSRSRSRSRGRSDTANPGNTLYVTGLSSRVVERDLKDHFSKEGKVIDCRLVVEPRTRISRGFAFVTMDTLEEADRAVRHLNHSVLEGRYITVEKIIESISYVRSNQEFHFININLMMNGQHNSFSHAPHQLKIANFHLNKSQHTSPTLNILTKSIINSQQPKEIHHQTVISSCW